MREIKFRVKTTEDIWTDGNSLVPKGEWVTYYPETFPIMWKDKLDLNTQRQYTGLKDKNGKEIYEGDIYTFDGPRKKKRTLFVVESVQSFFEAKGLDEGEYGWDYSQLEILGNTYENPNLLT